MKRIFIFLAVITVTASVSTALGQKNEKIKLEDYFRKIEGQRFINIPPDFSLNKFYEKNKKSFYFFDKEALKADFRPSRFFTGKEEVFIYRLLRPMTNEECLKFIRKQKGIPSNAQRLLIAQEQLGLDSLLDKDACIFGLDERKNLWFSPYGCCQIISICRGIFDRLLCNLACFEDGLPAGSYIIFSKQKR